MTNREIRRALYDWAAPVLAPFPVIDAEQNAPRPNVRPYVALRRLTGPRKVGQDFLGAVDADGYQPVAGVRELTFSAQAIGEGAFDLLEELQTSLARPLTLERLQRLGLVVWDEGNITNVTALLGPEFEEQASLDFFVRVPSLVRDLVGTIEHVTGEGTYIGRREYAEPFDADTGWKPEE